MLTPCRRKFTMASRPWTPKRLCCLHGVLHSDLTSPPNHVAGDVTVCGDLFVARLSEYIDLRLDVPLGVGDPVVPNQNARKKS